MKEKLFEQAIEAFDKENALDPNRVVVNGTEKARELAYSEWLTSWILKLNPNASLELRLAARCQHLKRWQIPRSEYPEGLKGYTKWKKDLAEFHATEASKILKDLGFDSITIERVRDINLKKNLKTDSEVQAMEDALCLVTLEYQIEEFSAKHTDEKIIDIIRKTWNKMSEDAKKEALKLKYSNKVLSLIQKAI